MHRRSGADGLVSMSIAAAAAGIIRYNLLLLCHNGQISTQHHMILLQNVKLLQYIIILVTITITIKIIIVDMIIHLNILLF